MTSDTHEAQVPGDMHGAHENAPGGSVVDPGTPPASSTEDTLDLELPEELTSLIADDRSVAAPAIADTRTAFPLRPESDLLDDVAGWGPAITPHGTFQLVPVHPDRDLLFVARWMNDPAVAAFWELAGPVASTAAHLRHQLAGDGRSVPCLGVLNGVPMSYWEIYRADLDPIARHYPARPQDTGVHLLIGAVGDRGRGVGTALLRAVSGLVLDHRPACARVIAEPDLRNTPSVAAFLAAGFRFSAEMELSGKRAALMIRDRALLRRAPSATPCSNRGSGLSALPHRVETL